MSLNVGLTFEEKFLMYSWFFWKDNKSKRFKKQNQKNTETLLVHGEVDQIVPSTHLLEAKDF